MLTEPIQSNPANLSVYLPIAIGIATQVSLELNSIRVFTDPADKRMAKVFK